MDAAGMKHAVAAEMQALVVSQVMPVTEVRKAPVVVLATAVTGMIRQAFDVLGKLAEYTSVEPCIRTVTRENAEHQRGEARPLENSDPDTTPFVRAVDEHH